MDWTQEQILAVLDSAAEQFEFPMLDNGYVYPAACRLVAYRSDRDWAITIEVFGFSPRAGDPDTTIYTFGSRLAPSKDHDAGGSPAARDATHDQDSVFPIDSDDWHDEEDVIPGADTLMLRGKPIPIPAPSVAKSLGIQLEKADRWQVFELCRALAMSKRDEVLATAVERQARLPRDLSPLLLLDDWHHPDLAGEVLPSQNQTFAQLAEVLVSADPGRYAPGLAPNTHWSHWPEAGLL